MPAFLLFLLLMALGGQSIPEVNTKFGRIQGKYGVSSSGKSLEAYLKLPYAKPPIGDLRFKNPQIWTENWSSARISTKNGPSCIQIDYEGKITGEEDCLYLNVFVSKDIKEPPSNKTERKLPVLIFIRGGSFNVGTTNSDIFSPIYLLNEEIVLVTFNYRLNFFGFYSTGNVASPGNYGLKDMAAVLKWVQDNIASFGGDPKSVTLFGNSAGAAAIHHLTLSQKTKGLFHKIITMSGSALAPWAFHPRENIRNDSINLARKAGCFNTNGTLITPSYNETTLIHPNSYEGDNMTDHERVECMRKMDARKLLNLTKSLAVWRHSPNTIFGPTLEDDKDGAIITIHPKKAIEGTLFQDIPWIIGVVADEGLGLDTVIEGDAFKELTKNFTIILPYLLEYQQVVKQKDLFVKSLIEHYFQGNISQNFKNHSTEMFGDSSIYWPVYEALQKQMLHMKSNIYAYHFVYKGTFSVILSEGNSSQSGVAHMDDVNYLFPFLNQIYKNLSLVNSKEDETMIDIMTKLWINFAKTGDPNTKSTEKWEPYKKNHQFMRIGNKSQPTISMEKDFLTERMKFWEILMKNVSYPLEKDIPNNNGTIPNDSHGGASLVYDKYIIFNCLAFFLLTLLY